jgi:hypothetical protein
VRYFLKKLLNKFPVVKEIIISIILLPITQSFLSLLFNWHHEHRSPFLNLYYKLFFYVEELRLSSEEPSRITKKGSTVKCAVFLFPKYVSPERNLFETGEELIRSFTELHADILVEAIFYDEDEFVNDRESALERIISLNPSHFFYLYGPNVSFSLNAAQLRVLLEQLDSYKIAISTDSIRLSHSYFLNKMRNSFDMLIGMDASMRFNTGSAVKVGPTTGCISQRTFEKVIQPYLLVRRDIDVLMLGSLYADRLTAARFLRQNGINVTALGGKYGKDRFSFDEYFRISCRAKIRVVTSFTEDKGKQWDRRMTQMKGHITQTIASASLLLVDSTYPTSEFFDEGKEFVSYSSLDELLDKIKWYLSNDNERVKVAMAAHERWAKNYLGSNFWKHILG